MNNFMFTLWDVEHGLSIWIQTPSGQNHCIDVGKNNDTAFSPYEQMHTYHNVTALDYLAISHPDKDHIEGLPDLIEHLGKPKCISRNKTLPDEIKYGEDNSSEYIKIFKELDTTYIYDIDKSISPLTESVNGGIFIRILKNTYTQGMSKNDTSLVVFYIFKKHLFVMPGDIEPSGWSILKKNNAATLEYIKSCANTTTLVAPHHGRESGYSEEMINDLSPDLILISDKFAKGHTDHRYYSAGKGLFAYPDGKIPPQGLPNIINCLSTKTKGRIRIHITQNGFLYINYNKETFMLIPPNSLHPNT